MRQPGTKLDVTVFADPDYYASFPQLYRMANDDVVIVWQTQELAALRAIPEHPHWQKVARPGWAISRDKGLTWQVLSDAPKVDRIVDATNPAAPLADGGAVNISFHQDCPKHALISRGFVPGYRPYLDKNIPGIEAFPISDFGPFDNFHPFGMIRMPDGSLLASGYAAMPTDLADKPHTVMTTFFLKSTDEGRTWKYLSYVPNPNAFSFDEADLVAGPEKNHLQVYLRVDWVYVPEAERPADVHFDDKIYGYNLYRSESVDTGKTWSEPEKLPLWGHPPCVRRLASDNLLLVYGYRQPPYGIRACLSRDNGKTWDPKNEKIVHTFDPGGYDLGYPVATQLSDGTIVCTYYGYASPDAPDSKTPHGIFASIFDEKWLSG